jgi:2,5-furandicarboxylate decarboxylase 1
MNKPATKEAPIMSNSGILDTRFRSALGRMATQGRLCAYTAQADAHLEIAAIMKRLDGGPALMFTDVAGHGMPVVGNLLSCQPNCEAAFGIDFIGIREFIGRALGSPKPPALVDKAPAQERVHTANIDLPAMLPALHHTAADAGRFITAGIVIVRDPETGTYNASYHRLQLAGGGRAGVKLDYGRHLRLAFERAKRKGEALPIAVCIGTDLALHYTAATMGSQMPEHADELAVAGGLCGRPLPVARAITQDLIVPAETEIVLEGRMLIDETVQEGPFGEFVGYLAPADAAPVFEVTAVTHRDRPIYHAINGFGRETIMLRKYVLEASLLKVLQTAVPIVVDADMTPGGLHRFHAVVQVRKGSPQHDGLQRNAIFAAFGALKDLDMVIVVDEDIDIRDPHDVEYALATRMEASKDLLVMPGGRGHEYVRVSQNGIRTKLGIDATVPFADKARFARCTFADVAIDAAKMTSDVGAVREVLNR